MAGSVNESVADARGSSGKEAVESALANPNDKNCHRIAGLRLVTDPSMAAGTMPSDWWVIELKGLKWGCAVTLGSTLWRGKCDKFEVPRKDTGFCAGLL